MGPGGHVRAASTLDQPRRVRFARRRVRSHWAVSSPPQRVTETGTADTVSCSAGTVGETPPRGAGASGLGRSALGCALSPGSSGFSPVVEIGVTPAQGLALCGFLRCVSAKIQCLGPRRERKGDPFLNEQKPCWFGREGGESRQIPGNPASPPQAHTYTHTPLVKAS